MKEEMKMLLNLTKEVTEYKVFFEMLANKIDENKKMERHYMDIDEIKPLIDAFKRNKELDVITFDNCEDVAYEQKLDA